MCCRESTEKRTCSHNSLAKNVRSAHTMQVEFYLGSVRGASQASLLVSPTNNLMLRTLSRGATYLWRFHAYRYRKVVQSQQGFRLHPA